MHEINILEDTRYQGPLSYQSFQALGWLSIVFMVVLAMLDVANRADPEVRDRLYHVMNVLALISQLSLPLLLIANFSQLLNSENGYERQLLRNGGAAVGISVAVYIVFERYAVGMLSLIMPERQEARGILTALIGAKEGFLAFNIFVDLFLCTLFIYFLCGRPKRVFTGKKIILFRMLMIIPVAYEITSMVLKGLSRAGNIVLPFWSFPLLTVKPPMTYVVFMILAIHLKLRERRFCKHGRSYEEYRQFLQTNRNSWHFSKFMCVLLIVTAIIDIINMIVMAAVTAAINNAYETDEQILEIVEIVTAMGVGRSVSQLFVAPLMLLYSYTRIPKRRYISMIIPLIGIAFIIIIVIEGIYQSASLAVNNVDPEILDIIHGWFE